MIQFALFSNFNRIFDCLYVNMILKDFAGIVIHTGSIETILR